MHRRKRESNLSQMATLWSVVGRAHQGPIAEMQAARQQLLERYGGAVRRYVLGALRNEDGADELAQEFALRFLRGDFHRADPQRGRFRDFVKTALFHLVVDHQRRQRARPRSLSQEVEEPSPSVDADEQFLESWRDELLARAWQLLAAAQEKTGRPSYAVLRFRADHPKLPSAEMAARLSEQLGRPFTAAGVRQALHRAREEFADLLVEEVAQSLTTATRERIEEELSDLGLLDYCRPALARRPG
jgi:RNA polymerase sigma factor (sigma-70 family)